MVQIDLKKIIRQYPDCLVNKTKFKAILSDCYPDMKRDINIIFIIYECGILAKLRDKTFINSIEYTSYVSQLEDEYGINPSYSKIAIDTWAQALQITIKSQPNNLIPPVSTISNLTPKVITPKHDVIGDETDYELGISDGIWFIKKFIGFEEDKILIPNIINGNVIEGIGENAFKGCVTVKEIIISDGIKYINNGSFSDCKALIKISLPSSLTRIGSKVSNNTLQSGVFFSSGLNEIIIPDSCLNIAPYTFAFCGNLKNIILPPKLAIIEKSMFDYCKNLNNIQFPIDLSVVCQDSFDHCDALKEIRLPLGVKTIEYNAFNKCNLNAMYIPPTVMSIGIINSPSSFNKWDDNTLGNNNGNYTIYCVAGSYAMKYAREHNIKCAKAQF